MSSSTLFSRLSIRKGLEGIDEKALRPSVTFRDLLYNVTMIDTTICGEPVCLRLVPLMFAFG